MRIHFFFLFLIVAFNINAQDTTTTDYTRIPDKVYMHLDKNMYSPGDTIWAKAYVFHRNNLQLSNNSYSLHIQMLSQKGEEVGTYKMLIVDGMGYGQIPIYDTMKPGFYQLIAHTGHMKNFGEQFFFKTTVEVIKKSSKLSIKTFFNKSNYNIGDTANITFKVYDEFHLPIPKQRFLYKLIHNEKAIKKGAIKCYEDGTANLLLPIECGSKENPPSLEVRYYEHEQDKEMEKTDLFVPIKSNKVIVRFFPEGGNLIQGMISKVAFEATTELGEAIEIQGVLQENGENIMNVRTMHQGMGFFTVFPNDAQYTFKITQPTGIDSIFTLPQAQSKGYNISYLKQDKENIYLVANHNYPENKNVGLWVSQYDKLLRIFDLNISSSRLFTLPKKDLPKGLVTLTLTDETNKPQAERLIYITSEDKRINISTSEEIYGYRKKVKVNLSIENPDTGTHLSVAVVDSIMAYSPNLDIENIKTYALIKSELRGKIPNINQYLKNDRVTDQNRNLLMMTHGWRRYAWIYNKQRRDSIKIFDFNNVDGQVMRNKKPHADAKVTAMVMGDFATYSELTTDEEGRFRINLQYEDRESQKVIFQALSENGNKQLKIELLNRDTLLFANIAKRNSDNLKPLLFDTNRYIKQDEKEKSDKETFMSYETKMLKELVVYGDQHRPSTSDVYFDAMKDIAVGSISGEDLIGDFSFYEYVMQASYKAEYDNAKDRFTIKARGGTSSLGNASSDVDPGAIIYLNDMSWGKDVSALDFLTKEEIIDIIVLDPDGAFPFYGSDGQDGAILVHTSPLDFSRVKTLNRNMTIFGRFIDSKEYYHPVYETKQQDSLVVVDNRITLHWEPFVETDKDGKASFDFYTDDISGTKQIIVQGIDEKGNLYYETKIFEVQATKK